MSHSKYQKIRKVCESKFRWTNTRSSLSIIFIYLIAFLKTHKFTVHLNTSNENSKKWSVITICIIKLAFLITTNSIAEQYEKFSQNSNPHLPKLTKNQKKWDLKSLKIVNKAISTPSYNLLKRKPTFSDTFKTQATSTNHLWKQTKWSFTINTEAQPLKKHS